MILVGLTVSAWVVGPAASQICGDAKYQTAEARPGYDAHPSASTEQDIGSTENASEAGPISIVTTLREELSGRFRSGAVG